MRKKVKTKLILFAAAVTIVFSVICVLYDRLVLPGALKVERSLAITYVNAQINTALESVLSEEGIDIADVCQSKCGEDGKVVAINTNGMLVNKICGLTVQRLSEGLNDYGENVVYLKSGTFTGLSLLSDTGFDVPVRIRSVGDAKADYETEVKSVGINQVSFRLYIKVDISVSAYNPIINDRINISRRIMLADIVYAGKVPDILPGSWVNNAQLQ